MNFTLLGSVFYITSSSMPLGRHKVIWSVISLNVFTFYYGQKSDLTKNKTFYHKINTVNAITLLK